MPTAPPAQPPPRTTAHSRRLMQIALMIVGAWVAVVVALFVLQRKMVFAAPAVLEVPTISNGELLRIGAGDTEVFALWVPPSPGAPVVVHFHGNAEQLAGQAQMASLYGRRGLGFLAVEYPGYGPMSEQAPSEMALIDAGERALRFLATDKAVPAERIVVQGRSLGSGVATALAAKGLASRLVLLSPFTSLVDVAASAYPFVPVGLLLRDRFDNAQRAADVRVPTLVIHGDLDEIVPYAHGKSLSEQFTDAELVTVSGAGHNDLLANGGTAVLGKMMAFALKSAVDPL